MGNGSTEIDQEIAMIEEVSQEVARGGMNLDLPEFRVESGHLRVEPTEIDLKNFLTQTTLKNSHHPDKAGSE